MAEEAVRHRCRRDRPLGPVVEGRLATASELTVSTKPKFELMETTDCGGVGGLVVVVGGEGVVSGSSGGAGEVGVARSGGG